jgi:shikimate dehydrogenase
MDSYCLMGNPIAHSRSPWIHTRFAQLTHQPIDYGKRLVPLDGFAAAVAAFRAEGGRGCNVTVPFKFEVPALATELTPRARLAQAANTLRFDEGGRLVADNTDGIGLVDDIRVHAGIDIAGRSLLLAGAGGAAAGALGPLIEAGAARIVVANRTAARAQELVDRHQALASAHGTQLAATTLEAPGSGFDIVVNATSASLSGGGVPLPGSVLKPGALACDMMYGPAARGFLDWAAEHGAQGRDGLGMLVQQAAQAFAFWRGVMPPARQVLAELRAVVG